MCRDRLTVLRPPRHGPGMFKTASPLITDQINYREPIDKKAPILPIS
jgi:hypothetical protein